MGRQRGDGGRGRAQRIGRQTRKNPLQGFGKPRERVVTDRTVVDVMGSRGQEKPPARIMSTTYFTVELRNPLNLA
jgi:hypothetical protein